MNRTIGLQLVAYGILLACLSYFTSRLSPEQAQTLLITGLAGGMLCLVWGVLAMGGKCRKAPPVLTLIVISYVVLGQVITGWMDGDKLSLSRTGTWLVTAIFIGSMAMLMRIVYSGVLFDLNPSSAGGSQVLKK